MDIVRLVFWNLAVPVGTALFLTLVRARYGIGIYAAAASLLIAFALGLRALRADVVYFHSGPLSAAGFESWALPGALTTIAVLCALRGSTRQTRTALVLVSFLAANLWFLSAFWIA